MIALSLRRFVVGFALVAMGVAALFHPLKPAYACSCMAPPPAGEARDQSDAVFSGTVRDVQAGKDGVLVTFDVARIWKGPQDAQLTLATSASSAACGIEFVAGEEYLVYGMAQDGQLSTNLCSRTAPLANAGEDVTALGEGVAPAAPAQPATPAAPEAGAPWMPFALGGIAVVALAAVGYAALVRREA